jgi:AraC family transcriptional regulator
MQDYVSIANVSDSMIRTESSVSASKPRARRGASPVWEEKAPESGRGSVNAEPTLDRLRAAVAEIFTAVNSGLRDERESAKKCMLRAAAILRIDPWFANAIEEINFPTERRSKLVRGGLAPWQVRRVTTHIEANLDATIRIKDLAALIKLSPSHFSRAFKKSFADSPHRYLMRRRLERAQGLMLTTNASLGQIAGDCGFADQAHFNKLFHRLVGQSPRAWRRVRGGSHLISDQLTLDAPDLKRLKPLDETQADGQRPRGSHGLDQIGVLGLNG